MYGFNELYASISNHLICLDVPAMAEFDQEQEHDVIAWKDLTMKTWLDVHGYVVDLSNHVNVPNSEYSLVLLMEFCAAWQDRHGEAFPAYDAMMVVLEYNEGIPFFVARPEYVQQQPLSATPVFAHGYQVPAVNVEDDDATERLDNTDDDVTEQAAVTDEEVQENSDAEYEDPVVVMPAEDLPLHEPAAEDVPPLPVPQLPQVWDYDAAVLANQAAWELYHLRAELEINRELHRERARRIDEGERRFRQQIDDLWNGLLRADAEDDDEEAEEADDEE
jgi:hypothetical protein